MEEGEENSFLEEGEKRKTNSSKGKDLLIFLRQLSPPEPENVIIAANDYYLGLLKKRKSKEIIYHCLIEGYKRNHLAPNIQALISKLEITRRKKCNIAVSTPGQIEAEEYIKKYCFDLKFRPEASQSIVDSWNKLKEKDRDLIDEKPFNIAIAMLLFFKDLENLAVEKNDLLSREKKANGTAVNRIYNKLISVYNS